MKLKLFSIFLFLPLAIFANSSWLVSTQKCIMSLQKNQYVFGKSELNCEQRTAKSDCSGFINNIMQKYFPNFYNSILNHAGKRPNTSHYFVMFSDFKTNSKTYISLRSFADLRAGDLIGWKYSDKYLAKHPTPSHGHLMLVLEDSQKTSDKSVFKLKVADSALSGHESDSRQANESGLEVGTISIQIDPNNALKAYDWSGKGHWEADNQIFMGRPLN